LANNALMMLIDSW